MAMIARIFSPFSWALWCATFIVLIVLSLLFVVQELEMVRIAETTIDQTLGQIQTEERPSSMCSEQEADAEETKLEIKHMAGAYVLSGILAAVGVVFSLTDRAKKQRKDPESKGIEDSEREEHHDLQDLRISAQDNTDLHSLVANLGKEILELKQIIVFNESTR